MPCPQCGTELLPGKKFCHACGARAQASCARCGEPLDAGFRFCPGCGASADASALPAESAPSQPDARRDPLLRHIPEGLAAKIRGAGAVSGERKRATVLFCDLVGSTAIAEGLDPEAYRELLDEFLELAFAEIYRYEGIVNQLAGDGFMALFGAPIAHEDAPERAIRAALGIQHALERHSQRQLSERGIELSARIGIHSGTVVVGTMGNDLKMDYTAIGDTTNLAARLQALAAPGSILLSESTHALVRDRFRTQPAGPFDVKGKAERVIAYEVLELAESSPMSIAQARGLTPLVGRDAELAQLEGCFRRLEDNLAQVVAIVGEAGSGKSRLIYEFKQRIGEADVLILEGRCSSLTRGVPYAPWEMMMRRFFGLRQEDLPEEGCRRVVEIVGETCGADRDKVIPYLCTMLSLPRPGSVAPVELNKQSFFDAMAKLVGHASMRRPVVMIVEDLHWIDDASLEMLEMAVAVSHNERLMLLVTHRRDFKPAWQSQAAFTQLHLRLLGEGEARAIVRARAGGVLPRQLEDRLLRRGEGNPFYLEELTRALIEEGALVAEAGVVRVTRPIESIRIPDTLQELLGARLDRLRPASKRVAQLASVFGRQFKAAQLAALLADDPGMHIDLQSELGELERRGVVHRNGLSTDEFRFGESLTQEVAYEGLLLRERRHLHERVGAMLEASAEPGAGNDRAALALIGHHYALSDQREKGILKLLDAAQSAEAMPSYGDALRLYRKSWDLAETAIEETHNGGGTLRAAALRAIRGWLGTVTIYGQTSAEDNERAARRGEELARELGDDEALASLHSTHGMITLNSGRERFSEGIELVEKGVQIAKRAGLERTVAQLSRGLSWAYLGDGRFEQARACIGEALAELERLGERERLTDTYLGARYFELRILYDSDDLEAAVQRATETWELAKSHGNRTIQTGASAQLATIRFRQGRYAEAEEWAMRCVEIAEQIDNPSAVRSATVVLLGVRFERAPAEIELPELDKLELGIIGGGDLSMNIDLIIEVLLGMGEIERARRLAELGLLSSGGRLREARNEISMAQVVLSQGGSQLARAEKHFQRGLDLARKIGARSLTARALLGLAQVEHARDAGADPANAKEALEIFRGLGLAHYAARAEKLLAAH